MTDDQQEIPEPSFNFNTGPSDIRTLANQLDQAEGYQNDDPEETAAFVEALKQLENSAEEARKNVFEDKLDEVVEPGQTIGNLTRQTQTRRYVENDAEAFDALLNNDLDPREYAKVNVTDLEDALGAKAEELLGTHEYSFYRRVD